MSGEWKVMHVDEDSPFVLEGESSLEGFKDIEPPEQLVVDQPFDESYPNVRYVSEVVKSYDESNCKYINDYKVLNKIARGSFASVKVCQKVLGDQSSEHDQSTQGGEPVSYPSSNCHQPLEPSSATTSPSCSTARPHDDEPDGVGGAVASSVEGTSRCCDEREQNLFAMKVYNKFQLARIREFKNVNGKMQVSSALDKLKNEVEILVALKPHPNLCKLIEVIEDANYHKVYLIFDLLNHGPLMNYNAETLQYTNAKTKDVFQYNTIRKYFVDIANGLEHLHRSLIVHRDLKPENLMLTERGGELVCVIIDLGNAKRIGVEDIASSTNSTERDETNSSEQVGKTQQGVGSKVSNMNTVDTVSDEEYRRLRENAVIRGHSGTFVYFSPEMCAQPEYNPFDADEWALVVSLYVCCLGRLPFYNKVQKKLLDCIASQQYTFPDDSSLTDIGRQNKGCKKLLQVIENVLGKRSPNRLRLDKIKQLLLQ